MSYLPADDLHAVRERIRQGLTTPTAELERCETIARSEACRNTFLRTSFEAARAAARTAGGMPLAGLAVSVKDLFDVAGEVTAAGSVVLADAPPATTDAQAVARLKAAGGVVIGRTNMTEFAYSGMGVNPHHGTPVNPCDRSVGRIPGGSSSGAAVSVATGAAFVGLGSDTGGSIRVPAALCGIVGFKNTARLVSAQGTVPLSTTLDTISAMTRSVRDAVQVHEILSARPVAHDGKPLAQRRFAVARTQMQDGMDATVARAFERTLRKLRAAGAHIEEIALQEIAQLGPMGATGGFPAPESYAWHRELLAEKASGYDPRVRVRIERGAAMTAYQYIDLCHARAAWISDMERQLAGFDAVLSPTVPVVAPPFAPVAPGAEHDADFFRANALLLRNPSTVNMLDGCAISIPCHAPDELPVGLMIWHGPLRDDTILNVAAQAEAVLLS
ncbi:amidase [Ramlibacter sp.]|uniref:amidase n=1 Tax=Ramlibacter sp. TaxID=1917967 RepID=UPI001804659B|nr:amidase [Ramlibacter sp.]MBA2673667.1 amidase [Ramlibacter sp.]